MVVEHRGVHDILSFEEKKVDDDLRKARIEFNGSGTLVIFKCTFYILR